ncbi:hypothetical protein GOODEAATRI_026786, partial [Goodea atripinnis]
MQGKVLDGAFTHQTDSVDIAGTGVTQPKAVIAGSRREVAGRPSWLSPPGPGAVMYRRPLQVAARCALKAAASRGACAKLCNVKETPQHSQEEVGAFTKLIEAMGFSAPLRYNKW